MARLSRILHSSVAAACIAAVGAPAVAVAPPTAPPSRLPLEIRVGATETFSRIEFHWAGGARAASRREGQDLILRFNRNAVPDLSSLRVFPPKWLKTASSRTVGGALEVVLTLADDADAKVGVADGATFVNLFAKPVEAKAASTNDVARATRPDPVPDGGIVRMQAAVAGPQVSLRFPWQAPLGAAVFRRGDTVWVVFDTRAGMDLTQAPKSVPQLSRIAAVTGPDYTVLRITSPADVQVRAVGEGGTWTVTFGAGPGVPIAGVTVGRDGESEEAALSAAVAGATRILWLDDPVVGDRVGVVTALAPSKGLAKKRQFIDLMLLASAQGLAIEPRASNLSVDVAGDLVRMRRPGGLVLSSVSIAATTAAAAPGLDIPQAAALPGLIDFENWSKLGPKGFFDRYDALQDAASAEAVSDQQNGGKAAQVQARMGLARFLIGSELSHEAIGVLNLLASTHQQMLGDPEFRALRGAAKVMAGRYAEATADFSSPAVANDASAALWRGYIHAQTGHWKDARKAFAQGYGALNQFAPKWRARFARADAEAGLALGDLAVARTQILMARAAKAGTEEDLATSLTQAKLYEAQGDVTRALSIYDALARTPEGPLQSAAILRATQARLAQGQITPVKAAETYDGLRYRWRGDATELETIRALGNLYVGLGRYREALEAWRSAGKRLPDLPQAIDLQNDLAGAFRGLFLDGRADGLEPVQSLALFFDFRELTPIGADGDMMVRKLARRLVDVDLLDQAAMLLKYQTENRLEGVAKAQVATDLALIYLMDRKPEDALLAINSSRTTVLPSMLNTERRLLTARALLSLGRYDQAREIIQMDRSAEADEVRTEIAWKQRDWKTAGPTYERRLGDRWKDKSPLSSDEEARVLRAAISYSLDGDAASLQRLSERFGGFVDQARRPDALRIALVGVDGARLSPGDFTRVVSEGDTFAGWVARMKQKFREKPSPSAPPAVRQAAAPAPAAAAKG